MRIATTTTFLLFNRALLTQNQRFFKISEQFTTQKRVNKPSDDPEAAKTILSFRDSLAKIAQYERNLNVADRNLATTESALQGVHDLLVRAKELAIQGANGTLNSDSRAAIGDEIQQLSQQLLLLSNTDINGEFVFAGYRTNITPYTLAGGHPAVNPAATYAGDANLKSIEISRGATLVIQVRGDQVFQGDGSASTVNVFQTLADLEVAVRNGNLSEVDPVAVPQMLENLDIGMDQVMTEVATIGAKMNRIESLRSQYLIQNETLQSFIAGVENVDLAEIAVEFQRAQTALEATVGSAAVILNLPSLMDFVAR